MDALVKSLLHVCSEHAVALDGGLPVTLTGMKQNCLGVRPLLVRAEGWEGCHWASIMDFEFKTRTKQS